MVFGIATDSYAQKKKTETVVFTTNIHCDNCKKRVENDLPFRKGVKDVKADAETKKVEIEYDPAKTNVATLRTAIEKLGYTATEDPKPEEKKE